jgi:hypothetical protein
MLKRFYLAVWVLEVCQFQWTYPLKLEVCSGAILLLHPTMILITYCRIGYLKYNLQWGSTLGPSGRVTSR